MPPHSFSLPASLAPPGISATHCRIARVRRVATELLFSYGTLRQPEVQRALFGREVPSTDDELLGFRLAYLTIVDPEVIALSGSNVHPILVRTGDNVDRVPCSVLELASADLPAADDYEVDDYQRVSGPLASGRDAWVYVAAAP